MLHFSIGNNFFYQNQYELALVEFQKAETIWKDLDFAKGIYWAVGAIGSIHEHQGKLKEAIKYSEEALEMAKLIGSPSDIAWGVFNVGSIATSAKNYDKSIKYLTEANKLARELNDQPLLGYTLEGLTTLHIDLENYSKALIYLDESYKIAKEHNDASILPNLYSLYSSIYLAKNDLQSYSKSINQYISLTDSLKNKELSQSMGDLKKDFETREFQKTQEIALLKKDREIFESRQLTWVVCISFATILYIVLTFFMKTKNKLVKEKNQILESSNQKILHQIEQLKTSNQDLKKYAYLISHDLKEPLRNISSFTTLLQRSLGSSISKDSKEYMSYIKNGTKQMNNLLSDLLAYSNIESKPIENDLINCKAICESVLKNRVRNSKQANIKIDELPNVKMKSEHFENVVYNLISNSLKFNENEKPSIYIEAKKKEHEVIFSISDNGIGIQNEYFHKIFQVFKRLNNREQYHGSGIGLAACKKIISDYGGSIWVESKPGIGSTFFFSIPTSSEKNQYSTDEIKEGIHQ